ncbi:protein of unknown function [Bradyrhizobium vignae]|uniref:Uncharacterized protein n=1 Tax=Bradyrhizobium vignae TaxID=1549949 RepID=A0A2U3QCU0_9BRAD|nr:protein of unknown function [Bradyrhizobium vignae]
MIGRRCIGNLAAPPLPPTPLAGEGWGEGGSAGKTPPEERTLTRAASSMRHDLSRKRER